MTDNRTTELLPCPHCGKVDTLEFATRRELEDCPNFDDCEAETCGRGFCDMYDNWDCVVCSVYKGGCGASGGYDECPAKAIEKWNTRTPEQAIAATLGVDAKDCENLLWEFIGALDVADATDADKNPIVSDYARHIAATLGNKRATHGTLTAEHVREVIERHVKFYEGGDYDEQAIADELNARAERTCECIAEYTESPIDGKTIVLHRCSVCHELMRPHMRYCPNCGCKVVDA